MACGSLSLRLFIVTEISLGFALLKAGWLVSLAEVGTPVDFSLLAEGGSGLPSSPLVASTLSFESRQALSSRMPCWRSLLRIEIWLRNSLSFFFLDFRLLPSPTCSSSGEGSSWFVPLSIRGCSASLV